MTSNWLHDFAPRYHAHPDSGLLVYLMKFKSANLVSTLVKGKRLKCLGSVDWRYYWKQRRLHQKGIVGFTRFVNRCVAHWHFWKFTKEGTSGRLRTFNSG